MRTTLPGWPAVLTGLEGEDRLSAPFGYRIRFATEAPVGTAVTLFFGLPGAQAPDALRRRPLNGHFRRISRIGRVGRDGAILEWQAEVVPRMWFLSRSSGFRIFHDRTIPQIVGSVLAEAGIAFADRIVVPEAHGTLEYCVQYDETALDFVSRLLEHAGIFCRHEHTDVAHTMCFTDNNAHGRIPHPAFDTLTVGDGVLDRFEGHYSFRTGTRTVRDHNLTRPQRAWDKTEAFADVAGADPAVVARVTPFEGYRYPGNDMARLRSGGDGAGWGQTHIPRVGQEVIVGFLNGDPDRPILTGMVYTADSAVPHAVPGHKTRSGTVMDRAVAPQARRLDGAGRGRSGDAADLDVDAEQHEHGRRAPRAEPDQGHPPRAVVPRQPRRIVPAPSSAARRAATATCAEASRPSTASTPAASSVSVSLGRAASSACAAAAISAGGTAAARRRCAAAARRSRGTTLVAAVASRPAASVTPCCAFAIGMAWRIASRSFAVSESRPASRRSRSARLSAVMGASTATISPIAAARVAAGSASSAPCGRSGAASR